MLGPAFVDLHPDDVELVKVLRHLLQKSWHDYDSTMKGMAGSSVLEQAVVLVVVARFHADGKSLPKQVTRAARKQLCVLRSSGRWDDFLSGPLW